MLALEFKTKTIGYILAAMGLVAGLAWNEAIKAIITWFFPGLGSDIIAKLMYAGIVTIFIVIASFYLLRLIQKEEVKK
ncbi:DUF5654 family protein [Candidatus Parcubacteria bacterium]|nr:DUF5654 family protein [Candidatus Parcubacteria bacterium]